MAEQKVGRVTIETELTPEAFQALVRDGLRELESGSHPLRVGRVTFGPDGSDLDPATFRRTIDGQPVQAYYSPTIPGPTSPRIAAEFEPSGVDPTEDVCAGCAPDDDAMHTKVLVAPVNLAGIVNLAIRVGRGTATIKELSEALAPFGVRRKA